jgi:hypothetical protein
LPRAAASHNTAAQGTAAGPKAKALEHAAGVDLRPNAPAPPAATAAAGRRKRRLEGGLLPSARSDAQVF